MLNLEGVIAAEDLRDALRDHAQATLLGEALGYVAYKKAQRLSYEARSELKAAEQSLSEIENGLTSAGDEADRQKLERQAEAKQKRIADLQELIKQLEGVPRPDTSMLRAMMMDIYPFDKAYKDAKLTDRYRR